MKLQVKQLDKRVCRLIAAALEMASNEWEALQPNLSTEAGLIALEFRHSIPLLVSECYDAPIDDVQVLGNEKGGHE